LDVVKPERPSLMNQYAEDPPTHRDMADPAALLLVDTGGDQPADAAVRAEHPQRSVGRLRNLHCQLDDALEHAVERELRGEGESGLHQHVAALDIRSHVSEGIRDGCAAATLRRREPPSTPGGAPELPLVG
jgi:hypothetical protein